MDSDEILDWINSRIEAAATGPIDRLIEARIALALHKMPDPEKSTAEEIRAAQEEKSRLEQQIVSIKRFEFSGY